MWQHVLETRRERIAARLPKLPDYSLRYLITGAVGAAYRARSRAVPGLRRDGTYQWFLPIHITSAGPPRQVACRQTVRNACHTVRYGIHLPVTRPSGSIREREYPGQRGEMRYWMRPVVRATVS
ncbi:MAG: hypothetical protein EB020_00850 [Proteobacteria bacterium]|nr:hypothetical protein [Pseudomonadota bacterium]